MTILVFVQDGALSASWALTSWPLWIRRGFYPIGRARLWAYRGGLGNANGVEPTLHATTDNLNQFPPMTDLAFIVLPIAAAGYSLLYLIFGGGIGGAIVIFIVAKLLGK